MTRLLLDTRLVLWWLQVSNTHVLAVEELESDGVHRDPFDRLLVCQSRVEPMLLLTVDSQLGRYGATVIVCEATGWPLGLPCLS